MEMDFFQTLAHSTFSPSLENGSCLFQRKLWCLALAGRRQSVQVCLSSNFWLAAFLCKLTAKKRDFFVDFVVVRMKEGRIAKNIKTKRKSDRHVRILMVLCFAVFSLSLFHFYSWCC